MSQFDFSNEEPDREVEHTLPLRGNIKLRLVHAGLSNTAYTDHYARIAAKTDSVKRAARGQAGADTLIDSLKTDRRLFSMYVIKGWSGVLNTDGDPVVFTKEACHEFLKALPLWIMRDLSTFAGNPMNFLSEDMPTEEEVEEQAGN